MDPSVVFCLLGMLDFRSAGQRTWSSLVTVAHAQPTLADLTQSAWAMPELVGRRAPVLDGLWLCRTHRHQVCSRLCRGARYAPSHVFYRLPSRRFRVCITVPHAQATLADLTHPPWT